jgi:hypothetical protein
MHNLLKRAPNLRVLELIDMPFVVNDATLILIANNCHHIEELNLNGSHITYDGLNQLMALKKLYAAEGYNIGTVKRLSIEECKYLNICNLDCHENILNTFSNLELFRAEHIGDVTKQIAIRYIEENYDFANLPKYNLRTNSDCFAYTDSTVSTKTLLTYMAKIFPKLEFINLDSLQNLDYLNCFKNLKSIQLRNPDDRSTHFDISYFFKTNICYQLESLHLDSRKIKVSLTQIILNCPNLVTLVLQQSTLNVCKEDIVHLNKFDKNKSMSPGLRRLEILEFLEVKFVDRYDLLSLEMLFSICPKLREVIIIKINEESANAIVRGLIRNRCYNLEILEVHVSNGYSFFLPDLLKEKDSFPNLKNIILNVDMEIRYSPEFINFKNIVFKMIKVGNLNCKIKLYFF